MTRIALAVLVVVLAAAGEAGTAWALAPAFTITKSHTPPDFTQGQTGVWNIVVNNTSPTGVMTSGTTTVTDTLAAGFVFDSFSGTGWSCGSVAQTVTCTNSTVVDGGQSFPTLALTVDVAANPNPKIIHAARAWSTR